MDEKAAESDDMRRPVPYSLAICEGLRAVIVLRCVQRFSIATWSMPEARETTHLDRDTKMPKFGSIHNLHLHLHDRTV